MKKITLLVAFLVAAFSYGQTSSGFVANPSFEDGSAAAIPKYQTLDNWKLGGNSSDSRRSFSRHTNNECSCRRWYQCSRSQFSGYWWRMEYKTYKHNISICWRIAQLILR